MKREQLIWLLTTAAGAAPLLEYGQGSEFSFDGLRFDLVNRQFAITIFEDLHFGEESWWRDCSEDCVHNDVKTAKVMKDILRQEKTDLAVLNGDLLTGEAFTVENYTSSIERLVKPFVDAQVPWASTYGNHDRSSIVSPRIILKKEMTYNVPNGRKLAWTRDALSKDDATAGTSNYFIPVYSSGGGGNPTLVMLLWFFDSRAGIAYKQNTPLEDFVSPEVVTWFNVQKQAIRNEYKRVIPSLAFVHIPTYAARGLQNIRRKDNRVSPGINGEVVGHQADSCDNKGRNCVYNGKDSPFMNALVETQGLMAVFSAHDHQIDWCMKWSQDRSLPDTIPATGNGLNLCFGRRTGYGGYSKTYKKGARKIVINEDNLGKRELETWIRLEDGSISGSITLNSTFGTDRYPAVPNQG